MNGVLAELAESAAPETERVSEPRFSLLGPLLCDTGHINEAQMRAAFRVIRRDPEQRFGDYVVEQGWVGRETVDASLGALFSSPSLLVSVRHRSTHSRAKRAMDVVGSLVGLFLLAIVFVPVWISIRLEGGGPVMFRQVRFGLDGRPFRIWKFRTMRPGAAHCDDVHDSDEPGFENKSAEDPRITRSGAFLRKTSIDELPQFINVLRGEMSLVGTRPPIVSEVVRYEPHHWARLQVKPGLTGEWQVRGRSAVKNFEDVVRLDMEYQRRWSIGYDVRLILKTFGAVVRGSGAY